MQKVNLYDEIKISLYGDSLMLSSNVPHLPRGRANLVFRAASLFMEHFHIGGGVYIFINKKIPIGAGLAGGSADAAATLIGLNKIFKTNLSVDELCQMGEKLGADVPFCIKGKTSLAEGIGEKLTPLPPLPPCFILLAKPNFSISTKWVYQNLNVSNIKNRPDNAKIIEALGEKSLEKMVPYMYNVLEEVSAKKYPQINQIKAKMIEHGAIVSMMSGSGPTVFGIFTDIERAQKCKFELSKENSTFLTKPL